MINVKQELMNKILKGDHEVPIICVPIVEKNKDDIIAAFKECYENKIEAVEWRVDLYEGINSPNEIRYVLEAVEDYTRDMLLIYTVRTKQQGGEIEVDESKLIDLYDVASESQVVDFIDVECFSVKSPSKVIAKIHENDKKVIVSHHEFLETPEEPVLFHIYEDLFQTGADIVKIAVMPKNSNDVVRLLKFTCDVKEKNPNKPLITISMGKLGTISRITGEIFGSAITFATLGKKSAPGQLTQENVKEILDVIHKA